MRDIGNYEGLYGITSCGKVWSYRTKKFLKPGKDKDGYLYVILCVNNERKKYLIHRLVAMAYIPNPDLLPTVNHKDENKTNNSINNLEWMFKQDNVIYSCGKKVICEENNITYNSLSAVAKLLNVSVQAVSQAIKNNRPCKGLHFKSI